MFTTLRKVPTPPRPQGGAESSESSNGPAEPVARPQTSPVSTPVTANAQQARWHPKLTGYRALVLALSAGLGASKIFLTYRKIPTASVTLEWIFSVILGLAVFWLGLYEQDHSHVMPWLFQRDYGRDLTRLIRILRISVPPYMTDERAMEDLAPRPRSRPPLTGYRLLVNFSVVSFGLSKAILTYRGSTSTPDVLDWVSVVIVSVGLYYLGLYENSAAHVWPAMFEHDYGLVFSKGFLQDLLGSKFFPYTFGTVLACALSYMLLRVSELIQPYGNSLHDRPFLLWSFRMMMMSLFMTLVPSLLILVVSISPMAECMRNWPWLPEDQTGIEQDNASLALDLRSVRRVPYATGYVFLHVFGLLSVAAFTCFDYTGIVAMWNLAASQANKGSKLGQIVFYVMGGMLAAGLPIFLWISCRILLSLMAPVYTGFGWLMQRAHDRSME